MKTNFLKISAIIFAAAAMAACGNSGKSIVGEWIQPIPGMEGMQGIKLEKGGKASSINMATLQYANWEQQGDKLVLSGQSIGNDQTIDFCDTLDIVKMTADSLVLAMEVKNVVDCAKACEQTPDSLKTCAMATDSTKECCKTTDTPETCEPPVNCPVVEEIQIAEIVYTRQK